MSTIRISILTILFILLAALPNRPTQATVSLAPEQFSCTDIPQSECDALVALYNSTDGPNWEDSTGWLETPTACSWHGVTCNDGSVTQLTLDGNNLSGAISLGIGDLTNLTELNLSQNQLSSLPPDIGRLTNLGELNLDVNQLSELPVEIGGLTNLTRLVLDRNNLSSLPTEIGELDNLTFLSLHSNQLSSLPTNITGLSNLSSLFLSNNQFSTVPAEISTLTNLDKLYLDSNLLSTIPSSMSNLTQLNELRLAYNRLVVDDDTLRGYIDSVDPDWGETQTVAPTDLTATVTGPGSIELSWTPIPFQNYGGFYEISVAEGATFTVHGTTENKSDSSYTIDGLTSGTTYQIRIRSYTPPHTGQTPIVPQRNELWSDYSEVVEVALSSLPDLLDFDLDLDPDSQPGIIDISSYPEVINSKLVGVDLSQLTLPKQKLKFNVSSDENFVVEQQETKFNASGSFTWAGEGDDSQVICVTRDDIAVCNLQVGNSFFQLLPVGKDNDGNYVHAVNEIDPRLFPLDIVVDPSTLADPAPISQSARRGNQSSCDDGSRLDIMVAYTEQAKNEAGGSKPMELVIEVAIEESNRAYKNSEVEFRLNLVHTMEVDYTESTIPEGDPPKQGYSKDLGHLINQADGAMDDVHTHRNTYGADIVSLIAKNKDYCGLAPGLNKDFLENRPDQFEKYAFSIVNWRCATGNYTLAHEIGHNLGLQHDRGLNRNGDPNSRNEPALPYGYGLQAPDERFRTIMAYGCNDVYCGRKLHFSNPNVPYNGKSTGIDHNIDPNNSADSARAMNQVRTIAANWRTSTGSCVDATGKISGAKWNDINGDGVWDDGEPGVPDWTISLVQPDGIPITTTTDADGNYSFTGLEAGIYSVSEVLEAGWTQIYPETENHVVELTESVPITENISFGNREDSPVYQIDGTKWHDQNGNGTQDPNEATLAGWTISLKDASGSTVISTATTDSDGSYSFVDLPAGDYQVEEENQSGWTQTYPPTPFHEVTLTVGQTNGNIDFGNQQDSASNAISGIKWEDANGDGFQDLDENGLEGWTIQLEYESGTVISTTTDVDGNYSFGDLPTGTYQVAEVNQDGWIQTFPPSGLHTHSLGENEGVDSANFGNQPVEQNTIACANITGIPIIECEALSALYNSTNGGSWTRNDDWLLTDAPCDWYGVTCINDHVHHLQLTDNGLSGTLPTELGNFSTLGTMHLDENQLTGPIPTELSQLKKLDVLSLARNQLSGSIPPELYLMEELLSLNLGFNNLAGSIPATLGEFPRLAQLDLTANSLSGPLPLSLSALDRLNWFLYKDTELCVPDDAAFQTWLAGVDFVEGTGLTCGLSDTLIDWDGDGTLIISDNDDGAIIDAPGDTVQLEIEGFGSDDPVEASLTVSETGRRNNGPEETFGEIKFVKQADGRTAILPDYSPVDNQTFTIEPYADGQLIREIPNSLADDIFATGLIDDGSLAMQSQRRASRSMPTQVTQRVTLIITFREVPEGWETEVARLVEIVDDQGNATPVDSEPWTITIDGEEIQVDAVRFITELAGDPPGERDRLKAVVLAADVGELMVRRGSVDIPAGTPTPAPTPVSTSTPAATLVPTATNTLEVTVTPVLTPTIEPTVTSTPSLTVTSVPTATVEPTATNTSEPTTTALPTATPEPTSTVEPTPTNTPETIVTPEPGESGPRIIVDDFTVGVDEEFVVTVDSFELANVGVTTLEILYDPAVLSVVSCTKNPNDDFQVEQCNPAFTEDRIRFNMVATEGVSGDIRMANITFLAIGAIGDSSPIDVEIVAFANVTGDLLDVSLTDGVVDIADVPLGDINCDGQATSVDMLLILQSDVGLRGVSQACGSTGRETNTFEPDIYEPACDVNFDGRCGAVDALFIGQCELGLRECPTEAPEDVDGTTLETDETVDTAQGTATIQVGSIPAGTEGRVAVPVRIMGAEGFAAGRFDLSYDPTLMKPVGCDTNPEELLDGVVVCNESFADNVVAFNVAVPPSYSGDVTLANVLFEIPSALDADSNISLEVASYVGDNPYEVVTSAEAMPMELPYSLFLPTVMK